MIDRRVFPGLPEDPLFRPNELCEVLVPGRAARVELKDGNKSFACIFVHNFGLSSQDVNRICNSIKKDRLRAHNDPTMFGGLLLGDFNIPPEDEPPVILSKPVSPHPQGGYQPLSSSARPFQRRWNQIFESLVEVKTSVPTHFHMHDLTVNRIDRAFWILPRSCMIHLSFSAGVTGDPVAWSTRGMSDHSPIFVSSSPIQRKRSGNLPLKKEWCRHPLFESRLSNILEDACLGDMEIEERRELILEAMRETALFVRDYLFVNDPASKPNTLLRLSSIARAVWYNDLKLAKILTQHSDLGRQFLGTNGFEVALRNPEHFEEVFAEAKAEQLTGERAEIPHQYADFGVQSASFRLNETQGSVRGAKCRSKLDNNMRKSLLWHRSAPKLALDGVILSPQEAYDFGIRSEETVGGNIVVSSPADMAKANFSSKNDLRSCVSLN